MVSSIACLKACVVQAPRAMLQRCRPGKFLAEGTLTTCQTTPGSISINRPYGTKRQAAGSSPTSLWTTPCVPKGHSCPDRYSTGFSRKDHANCSKPGHHHARAPGGMAAAGTKTTSTLPGTPVRKQCKARGETSEHAHTA